jgi:hypothetical protein
MASQEHSSPLSACLCIVESSSVSKFAVTNRCIWQLAAQKPKLANAHCPAFIVAQQTYVYGAD